MCANVYKMMKINALQGAVLGILWLAGDKSSQMSTRNVDICSHVLRGV